MPESQPPSPTPGPKATGSSGPTPDAGVLSRRFVERLAYIITGCWVISFGVDLVVKSYDPPATVHALMMAVAGTAFTSTLIQRNGSK